MSTTIRNQQTYPFMMIPKRIWEMKLSDDALRLFCVYIDFAGTKGQAWPTNRAVAEKVWPNLSLKRAVAKIQDASKELSSKNMIEKQTRENQSTGQISNMIVLHDCADWHLPDQPKNDQKTDLDPPPEYPLSEAPPPRSEGGPPRNPGKSLYIEEKESLNEISSQSRKNAICAPDDPSRKKSPKKPDDPKPSSLVFEAYSESFQKSYRDKTGEPLKPVRNARVNKICLRLVQQFGLDEAQMLVRFLLQSRDRRIVENQHALESLTDGQWQALRTQLHTGRGMTSSQARKIDSGAEMDDLLKRQMERIKAKYGEV